MAGEAVTQQVGINFLRQTLALRPIPDSDLYGACGDGIAELADEYLRFTTGIKSELADEKQ